MVQCLIAQRRYDRASEVNCPCRGDPYACAGRAERSRDGDGVTGPDEPPSTPNRMSPSPWDANRPAWAMPLPDRANFRRPSDEAGDRVELVGAEQAGHEPQDHDSASGGVPKQTISGMPAKTAIGRHRVATVFGPQVRATDESSDHRAARDRGQQSADGSRAAWPRSWAYGRGEALGRDEEAGEPRYGHQVAQCWVAPQSAPTHPQRSGDPLLCWLAAGARSRRRPTHGCAGR